MMKLRTKLAGVQKFARNDSGATAIEYGLIAGLVSVVIIAALIILGPELAKTFGSITDELKAANP